MVEIGLTIAPRRGCNTKYPSAARWLNASRTGVRDTPVIRVATASSMNSPGGKSPRKMPSRSPSYARCRADATIPLPSRAASAASGLTDMVASLSIGRLVLVSVKGRKILLDSWLVLPLYTSCAHYGQHKICWPYRVRSIRADMEANLCRSETWRIERIANNRRKLR